MIMLSLLFIEITYWYRNDYPRLPIIAIHVTSRFFVWTTNEICINYKQSNNLNLSSKESKIKIGI